MSSFWSARPQHDNGWVKWTALEDQILQRHFPDMSNDSISRLFFGGIRSPVAVRNRSRILGLSKSEAYRKAHDCRFAPGMVPWNLGLKGSTGTHPNTAANHFRPGHAPPRTKPVGSLRIVTHSSGRQQVQRKISDAPGLKNYQRWLPVARIVWEAAHGPVPPGHVVIFADPRLHTIDPDQITPDKLICISRRENAYRNSYWARLPHELAELVQLRGALQRRINERRQRRNPQPKQPQPLAKRKQS